MSGRPEPRATTDFTLPAAPQRMPGLPENFAPYVFGGFAGLNTKASRPAIGDQECAWIDNFMPLGSNNARTMYDVGAPIYTAASGLGITSFGFGNISDSSVCMVVLDDGSMMQTNVATTAVTSAAAAGTFLSPTEEIGLAQWGSQYIIHIAPQTGGYFLWDGTRFFRSGTLGPQVTLDNSGAGYTGQPSMVAITGISGQGRGLFSAELSSTAAISRISVTAPGSGYTALSYPILAFSAGGSNRTATAYASIAGGRLSGVTIADGGTGYTAGTTVEVLGGGGYGAAIVATASGTVSALTIADPGAGYVETPTIYITDPNNSVAQATVAAMPFNVQGTAVETYSNRAWTGNGHAPATPPPKNLQFFSAPADPANFQDAGAGSFLLTDSFIRVGAQSLKQSNGFLYFLCDSSVQYLAGVQTQSVDGIPVTTFSLQNTDPQVGTPWPKTVQVLGRAIVFANTFGVHAVYGGAVRKVSDSLDGIYVSRTPTGVDPAYDGLQPSAAVATIFGISCYVLLLPIVDPISRQNRNALFLWDGNRWWSATQSVEFTQIACREINSVLTAYGTDGHAIYPLFQTPSNSITKVIRSKLWRDPSVIAEKTSQNVQGVYASNATDTVSFTVSVDTEKGSVEANVTDSFEAVWTATGGASVTWTATGGAEVTWLCTGLGTFVQRIENAGRLIGTTLSTTGLDFSLVEIMVTAQLQNLRT
jgi:hypothetical protein